MGKWYVKMWAFLLPRFFFDLRLHIFAPMPELSDVELYKRCFDSTALHQLVKDVPVVEPARQPTP